MGACISTEERIQPTWKDNVLHQRAEFELQQAKRRMARQVKVLLLGAGDSGKSTIIKQMRLIHGVNFSTGEIEYYRQLVFSNLTHGLSYLLEAMQDADLKVGEDNAHHLELMPTLRRLEEGEPFPIEYLEPLGQLWHDPGVQEAWSRANEFSLPDNLEYFFSGSSLDRFFSPSYTPSTQDILRCRAETKGLSETTFDIRDHEFCLIDVGGQKSERRKWIHCFQDVTNVLFVISLSGYDQYLVEDRDANQMQDAMTIWDSICHSHWFRQTSLILFLNKNDLFERKIALSDIKNFFPDYEGEPGNAQAGREYFKRRFLRLSRQVGRNEEREIYIHTTNATDTYMLRIVLAAVEVLF